MSKKRWGIQERRVSIKPFKLMYLNEHERNWIEYIYMKGVGLIEDPKFISFCRIRKCLRGQN